MRPMISLAVRHQAETLRRRHREEKRARRLCRRAPCGLRKFLFRLDSRNLFGSRHDQELVQAGAVGAGKPLNGCLQ
jgi:hypothetical protein